MFVRSRWAPEAAQKERGDREKCDAGNLWDGHRKILVHASVTFENYAQCDECYYEVCMSAELTINKVNTICRDQGNSDEDDESEDDAENNARKPTQRIGTQLRRFKAHKKDAHFEEFVLQQLSAQSRSSPNTRPLIPEYFVLLLILENNAIVDAYPAKVGDSFGSIYDF